MRFTMNAICDFPVVAVTLSSVLFALSSAHAEEPLRWNFDVGEKLHYDMKQEMTLATKGGPMSGKSISMEQRIEMTWDVQGVNETGEAVIQQKLRGIRMKGTTAIGRLDYDSESEEAPTGMTAMVAPVYDAITQGDFELTLSARGEVKDLEIPDEVDAALKNAPGAEAMGNMSAEGLKKMLSQAAFVLPEGVPGIGDTVTSKMEVDNPIVGKQTVETTYTYDGTKELDGKTYAVFKPELTMSFAGNDQARVAVKDQTSSGEVLFDIVGGHLSTLALKHSVTMEMSSDGQIVEQKIDQKIDITVQSGDDEGAETATGPANANSEPEVSSEGAGEG